MYKPEIKIVEYQNEEINDIYISDYEKEQLLIKYGYDTSNISINKNIIESPNNNLSFEEMVAKHNSKLKEEEMKRNAIINGLTPKTFNDNDGYNSQVKYSEDSDTGFNFKVTITTNMNLPNN
jgi:hypothetical protein